MQLQRHIVFDAFLKYQLVPLNNVICQETKLCDFFCSHEVRLHGTNGIMCSLRTPRPTYRLTYRPIFDRYVGRHIDRLSAEVSLEMCRSRCVGRHVDRHIAMLTDTSRSTHRLSVGPHVDR